MIYWTPSTERHSSATRDDENFTLMQVHCRPDPTRGREQSPGRTVLRRAKPERRPFRMHGSLACPTQVILHATHSNADHALCTRIPTLIENPPIQSSTGCLVTHWLQWTPQLVCLLFVSNRRLERICCDLGDHGCKLSRFLLTAGSTTCRLAHSELKRA